MPLVEWHLMGSSKKMAGLANAPCKCAIMGSNYFAIEFNIFALFLDRFLTKFVFSFQVSGNLL